MRCKVSSDKISDVKKNILRCAIAEFARHGIDGARVDRIADRAEINKRMIYYYFGSKEELYQLCLSKVYGEIAYEINESLGEQRGKSPVDEIIGVQETYFNYLSEHPEYVSLISWENLRQGRDLEMTGMDHITHPVADRVKQVLEENNLLPEGLDSRRFIVALLGTCFFYFSNCYSLSMVFGADFYLDDEKEKYLESMKKMLAASLRSPENIVVDRQE
jgi:TetR/AcrR family transcriptional regulator